jgi:Cu+-exporting ATPase
MADGDQTQGAKDAASGHDACRHHDHHHHDAGHDHAQLAASCCSGKHGGTADPEAEIAIDPVCGMKVKRATAKHRFEYQGNEYLFCCARCRERFQTDPESFLKPKESEQKQGAAKRPEPAAMPGAIYTCPMDPEVRQIGPGTCPICGMALEPEQVSLDQGSDP